MDHDSLFPPSHDVIPAVADLGGAARPARIERCNTYALAKLLYGAGRFKVNNRFGLSAELS
jgi:hypothetical protein